MGKINIEKHAKKFLWALDKLSKTEMPKTEDEFIKLSSAILRPIIKKTIGLYQGEAQPFAYEQTLFEQGEL